MTQIAQEYHISRTFLSQLSWAAKHHLEDLLSDPQPLVEPPDVLREPWIFLWRLEGKCSIPSLSSIFKHCDYQPNSVGSLREYLRDSGRGVPSTLSMPHKQVVFSLSAELLAIRAPILVTIDAQSTAILKIELAAERSANTWETPFQDLGAHRFHRLGMASDRGVGLQAGYQAAWQEGFWVCDPFHAFQDLFHRCHQLESKAYAALGKESKAAETCANAQSEANLHKRLEPYAQTRQACEHAIERDDQRDLLRGMLSETFHLCSDVGRLHTVAGVRADLPLLLSLMEAIEDEKLPKLLKPIRAHIDAIFVPFRQVELIHAALLDRMPEQIVEACVRSWHHDHLSYQSHGKKKP